METSQGISIDMVLTLVFVFGLLLVGLYFLLKALSAKRVEKNRKKKQPETLTTAEQSIEQSLKERERPDPSKASLKDALEGSRRSFWSHLSFSSSQNLQISDVLDKVEEALYMGDLGPQTVAHLVEASQEHFTKNELTEESLRDFLKLEMSKIFGQKEFADSVYEQLRENNTECSAPLILLIVGVNGAGKTTTIGKLAGKLVEEGKTVLIAAGDTFRAAAEAQLKVWTERAQAEIFSPEGVKDPGAVAYDAVAKSKAKGFDVCIIDTAGRLHTQDNLMEELIKVKKVIAKVIPEAPHHTWLVLDANSGQNALFQARNFHDKLDVTGVVLTKMDGTAKGGVALGVVNELSLPVRYIGIGEKAADLKPFNQKEFVDSII